MKFNFKKIASVLASTVMLSSTLALAAAANFPAPFVQGGQANAAIVYGSSPLAQDQVAVMDINTALTSAIASQPSTTTTTTISGQDVVELDRPSSKLHLGAGTTDVFGRSITATDMATLLADGTFTSNGDNKDHAYTQKVDVANMTYALFDDSDYASDAPTLGIRIPSGSAVLNYTLTFTDQPAFNDNLLNSEISLMGKNYFVSSVTNSSAGTPTITLLDSANTQTINEGDTKSVQIGGKTYDVTVSDVSSTGKAKVSVAGKTSSSLSVGATYKVADGFYIGVKDVSYKSKDSAVSNAELAFGSGKLQLQDGADVQLNDNSINDNNKDDVIAHVVNTSSNTLNRIVLEWKASQDRFVTQNSSLVIPGFESIKVSTTGVTFPTMEEGTLSNDGKYTMQLSVPIKSGTANLNLLSNNASSVNFTTIGKDYTTQLRTSGVGTLTFNATTDENFIASWASGQDAETYELYATSFRTDNSVNKTTVKDRVGTFSQDVQQGDTISLGNVQLTVGAINKNDKSVNFTAGNGVNFHTLYTESGLKVYLPYPLSDGIGAGALNLTNGAGTNSSYNLVFTEKDKNGNVAAGNNVTYTIGATSKGYVTVSGVTFNPAGSDMKQMGNTNVFVGYSYSAVPTKVTWDQGPDQETAIFDYFGSETFAKVYVTDVSAAVSSGGGSTGSLSVSDSEVSTVSSKNLIVVGGSCINTVAASLLGSSTPLCGPDWEAKTGVGAGSFLIQTFTSPWSTGKIATLVAGYNQGDTANAAKYLTTQNVDVSAVGKRVGTTATTASLVTS